jgi:hypothetical protein
VELDRGTEIVYFEERGSWMLRADRARCLDMYMTSLSATSTPEQFCNAALPLSRLGERGAFFSDAAAAAMRAATVAQRSELALSLQRPEA